LGITLLAWAVISPAVADVTEESLTVGKFLVEIARTLNLACSNESEAVTSLRSVGYDIPAMSLGAGLTQGDVVTIANALGRPLSSTAPGQSFSRLEADRFLESFSRDLQGSATSGTEASTDGESDKPKTDPLTKGKGKKKGLHKQSPSEPI
jgi:hypothetical protein